MKECGALFLVLTISMDRFHVIVLGVLSTEAVMKFAYEDLYPEQFENLVIAISRRLFDISVQGIATGLDGGQDANLLAQQSFIPAAPLLGPVPR